MASKREREQGIYSEKFRIMLEMISHPDGGKWTGTKMARATDGQVISSYFSSLRDGHVDVPRADKLEAIAAAMEFPTELWFKDIQWWRTIYDRWLHGEGELEQLAHSGHEQTKAAGLADLVNRLFEVRRNPDTDEPFTSTEVAAQSRGALTVEQVDELRSGTIRDPTWGQILALCEIFEVPPTYFAGMKVSWSPSPAMLKAAEARESYVTFTNSLNLSSRDRSLLQSISQHLRREGGSTPGKHTDNDDLAR